jgi:uncharacterized membrane protein
MQYSLRKLTCPLALAFAFTAPTSAQVEDIGAQAPQLFLISGDGEVGHGQFSLGNSTSQPYRWSAIRGVESLENPLSVVGYANDISDDGSTVVGYASVADGGFSDPRALRWDASGAVIELTPTAGTISEAFQVSGDGSVAAGIYRAPLSNFHACVWDAAGTLTDIHPTFGGTFSTVIALSDDGSTVLGRTFDPVTSVPRYFLWKSSTGTVELPPFGGEAIFPESITADGTAIVGRVNLPTFNDFGIFYWSAATGYIVADPALGEPSQVGISRDGNSVFGLVEFSIFNDDAAIFTWSPGAGFQFDQPGMELSLFAASFDGSVLVGSMGGAGLDRSAYRWSAGTSFETLAASTDRSLATSVSNDGTVVGGAFIADDGERRSVVWRESGRLGANYCGPAAPNSSGVGAKIELRGSNVTALQSLTLTLLDAPQNSFGIFLASDGDAFIMHPGGSQGTLCLGGTGIVRLDGPGQIFNTGGDGTATVTIDPSVFPSIFGPIIPQFGQEWYFQAWFRDAPPLGPSNFSDGATVRLF